MRCPMSALLVMRTLPQALLSFRYSNTGSVGSLELFKLALEKSEDLHVYRL